MTDKIDKSKLPESVRGLFGLIDAYNRRVVRGGLQEIVDMQATAKRRHFWTFNDADREQSLIAKLAAFFTRRRERDGK
jgi:hypothetical protein